ncbi:integral membrane sensor signal transduction histidine kinase [Pseudomonas putida S11]|nr:integral membrane sensor signal transduction histidine kinase [Pseudomonas putida S11]
MKTPLWFPQSFFARTLWLVLIVVLFSKALTLVYLLMNEDVLVDRQYSHGVALTLRAYWAADEENRDKIAEAAGLIRVTGSGVPEGEQHWPYSEIYQRQMQAELGEDTEVRLRIHAPPALWVNAPSLGPGWLKVPLYPHPLRGQKIWNVLGWFLAIGLLSTASAWIFVRQLNQPLKRLVFAARQLGQGRSVRLPISDTPSEMTEVYKAFNQMAEDVEQAGRERELMLAGVSHDLRTPLTRLRLSLSLLDSDSELSDDMVRDIEDMDAILDQFLAFIRDGRDEPVEEVDLADLVREVVAPYNQPEERVRLCLEPIPAFPLRRVSLKRMLGNLIGNALHHAGKGVRGGRLCVGRRECAVCGAERAGPRDGDRRVGAGDHLQPVQFVVTGPGGPKAPGVGRGDRQADRGAAWRECGVAQSVRGWDRGAGTVAFGVVAAA